MFVTPPELAKAMMSLPAAKGAPVYHGQGSFKDAEADRLRRWMLVVAKGVAQAVGPNAGPVVAAHALPVLVAGLADGNGVQVEIRADHGWLRVGVTCLMTQRRRGH